LAPSNVKTIVLLTTEENENPVFNANIIVTTIGSLFSYLNKKKLILDNMKFLIIDETDKLF